jgi:hypothetical protein
MDWIRNAVLINLAVAGLVSLIIVCSVAYISLQGKPIPDVLSNWGGIILGFYFGSAFNLIKEYMVLGAAPRA